MNSKHLIHFSSYLTNLYSANPRLMPTQSLATSRPENGNKKQLNSMLENLSEEALAQLREEAESLHQQEKSPL